ncbi:MAG: hypothetical protein HHAS10_09000 [Candidatus Altimarinota bacterium]
MKIYNVLNDKIIYMPSKFQQEFILIQKDKIELFGPFSDKENEVKILILRFNENEDTNFILETLTDSISKETYIDTYNLLNLLCKLIENNKILNQETLSLICSRMEGILDSHSSDNVRIDALEIIYATRQKNIDYFTEWFNRAIEESYEHIWGYFFIKIFGENENYSELLKAFKLTYEKTIYPYSMHRDFNKYFSKIPENLLLGLLREISKEISINTNGIIGKTQIDAVLSIEKESARLFLDRIKGNDAYLEVIFEIIKGIFKKLCLLSRPYDGFSSLLKEASIVDYMLQDLQSSGSNYFTQILGLNLSDIIPENEDRAEILLSYDTHLQFILSKLLTKEEIVSFCENEKQKNQWRIDFPLYEYIKYQSSISSDIKDGLLIEFEKNLKDEIANIEETRKHYKEKNDKELEERNKKRFEEIELGFKYLKGYNNFYFLVYKYHTEKELFNTKQTKLLKDKIIEFLEDKTLDPKKAELIFEKREINGSSQYTSDWYVQHYFETTLIVGKSLGIDLGKFKDKIYSYLPFAYSEGLSIIMELLDKGYKLNPKTIRYIISVYDGSRTDGLKYHMTGNFIHLLEKQIAQFKTKTYVNDVTKTLKSILLDEEISQYNKEELLNFIYRQPRKKSGKIPFFTYEDIKDLFSYFKDRNDGIITENPLSDISNKILVKHFQDNEATQWRISKIMNLHGVEMKFDHPELVVYSPSDFENEITSERNFIDPFGYLKDKSFKKAFLELLKDSFTKRNYHYYDYIQDACTRYFLSIGNKGLYRVIINLVSINKGRSTENFEYKYLPKIKEKFKVKLKDELITEALSWKDKFNKINESLVKEKEVRNELITKISSLESYIENTSLNTILYVEGKTDYQIVKIAKEVLEFQGKIKKFGLRILIGGGASGILKQMYTDIQEYQRVNIRFGLFDFDFEGFSSIDNPNRYKIGFKEKEWGKELSYEGIYKKHTSLDFYILTLPFEDLHHEIQYQVKINPQIQDDSSGFIHLQEKAQLTIEHLFYGKKDSLNKVFDKDYKFCESPLFRKINLPNSSSYLEIGGDKLKCNFATLIEELGKGMLGNTKELGNDLFDGFIPIFKFIEDKLGL